MNYQWIKEYLNTKDSRPAGNNRRYVRVGEDFGYQLHSTIVVRFTLKNNLLILNNGGFYSRTSAKAINEALSEHGYWLHSVKGNWFVRTEDGEEIPYDNNMKLRAKRHKMIKVKIMCGNSVHEELVMTEVEYKEYRLQMSTGDFHTHKIEVLK